MSNVTTKAPCSKPYSTFWCLGGVEFLCLALKAEFGVGPSNWGADVKLPECRVVLQQIFFFGGCFVLFLLACPTGAGPPPVDS